MYYISMNKCITSMFIYEYMKSKYHMTTITKIWHRVFVMVCINLWVMTEEASWMHMKVTR